MANKWTKNPPDRKELFWAKVDKNGPIIREELGPCWVWTGARNTDGYGNFWLDGVTRKAHVVSWIFATEQDPKLVGLFICHHCDNPSCVRPSHLFDGTNGDNQRDASSKKRHSVHQHPEKYIGEGNIKAKLTEGQVREIRALFPTHSASEISRLYGMGNTTINRIVRGVYWKHLI